MNLKQEQTSSMNYLKEQAAQYGLSIDFNNNDNIEAKFIIAAWTTESGYEYIADAYMCELFPTLAKIGIEDLAQGEMVYNGLLTIPRLQAILESYGFQIIQKDAIVETEPESNTTSTEFKEPEFRVLNTIGINLTQLAKEGKLDGLRGRDAEVKRLAIILGRRRKSNPVLIGDPGVGKTAIVEGLAVKIVKGEVENNLKNKIIFSVDMASVLAAGEPVKIIKAMVAEIKENPQVIVFIDELHTIVGTGANGSLDIANMLKPALSRGDVRIIGATTLNEYRNYIEKDGALARRFLQTIVNEPSEMETREILMHALPTYQKFHKVTFSEEIVNRCTFLAGRYITSRCFPDKAFDVMDEAGSLAKLEAPTVEAPVRISENKIRLDEAVLNQKTALRNMDYEAAAVHKKNVDRLKALVEAEQVEEEEVTSTITVEEHHVARIVSMITNIPVTQLDQDDTERLRTLNDVLSNKIIGQASAVEEIVRAVKRSRSPLRDTRKPSGAFLFVGPTGVGKTELTRALASQIFGDEEAMTRIDMSEMMEGHSVAKLIGAPPGYVGYDQPGQLTESVRRKPYQVLLLDEVEKAHPRVLDVLLQVFDAGRLTDSQGRKVDFTNTIIIMTTNLGTAESAEIENPKLAKQEQMKVIKGWFRPEFLNRLTQVITFNKLSKPDVLKISRLVLNKLVKRAGLNNIHIEYTDRVVEMVAELGWDPEMGARPIERAVQKYVEDELTEDLILNGMATQLTIDALSWEEGKWKTKITR